MRSFTTICLLLLFVEFVMTKPLTANEIVVDTNVEVGSGSGVGTDFRFTVCRSPIEIDETSVWFDLVDWFDDGPTTFATFRFIDTNIDEASDWYLAQDGDAFTGIEICNESFELWGGATKDGNGLLLGNEITVAVSDSNGLLPVYLGVNTGSFFDLGKSPPGFGLPRQIFGWVELNIVDPNTIQIVNSAISYGAWGITIGRDFLFGDINCDGRINLTDIQPFVDLLINGKYMASADFDEDGLVTLLDVAPFVDVISNN